MGLVASFSYMAASPKPKIRSSSVLKQAHGEYNELVFENGQIVIRGRSASPSCISYNSHLAKAQANDNGGEVVHTQQQKPRLSVTSNSMEYRKIIQDENSGSSGNGNLGLRDFSLFLKLGELPKANNGGHHHHHQAAIGPSSSNFQELKTNPAQALKTNENNQDLLATKMDQVRQVAYPPKELPLPDEQSEAPVHGNPIRRKPDPEKSMDHSLGASNDSACYSLKRRNEESEGMASLSENFEEEEEGPKLPSAHKRRRTSEIHNLSERKRRDKINKKMQELHALIPNSNKADKASMLDNAIEHLKSLQLQIQMMSTMGPGLCMGSMMLPTGMQQIQAASLGHFSPMGLGMGMRMPIHPTPFLNSALLGLSGGMLPMAAMSHPIVMPLIGRFSMPSVPVPPIPGGAASVELRDPAGLCTSVDGVQNISSEFQESVRPQEKV